MKKIFNFLKYIYKKIFYTIKSIIKITFLKLIPNIFNYFVSTLEDILFTLIIDVLLIYFIINNSLQQFLMTCGIYLIIITSRIIKNKITK